MATLTLSPELLSVLVCPKEHGKLSYSNEKNTLTCQTCSHTFPIENGVPNMLK
jgi:uncharacterized protein YbaR (Trm112 family)